MNRDILTLNDGTFFHVNNGNWDGYITTENGNKVCYAGVSRKNPTENYVNRFIIRCNSYELNIEILDEFRKPEESALESQEEKRWKEIHKLEDKVQSLEKSISTVLSKLDEYYKQQKENDYFSDNNQKNLVCRMIRNCQKIVVETMDEFINPEESIELRNEIKFDNELKAARKERQMWYRMYLLYDDNRIHADLAFTNNKMISMTSTELHAKCVDLAGYLANMDENCLEEDMKPYYEEYKAKYTKNHDIEYDDMPPF